MARTASVAGCISCGALYSAGPGDSGLCSNCSDDLAPELPARTQTSPAPQSPARIQAPSQSAARIPTPSQPTNRVSPAQSSSKPPRRVFTALRPSFRVANILRRLRPAFVGAIVAAGAAAWLMPARWRTEAWTEAQHGDYSRAWKTLRNFGLPGAWAKLERTSSDAWAAVRVHLPFQDPPAKAAQVVTPHRRAQPGKATAKRGREGSNAVSSMP